MSRNFELLKQLEGGGWRVPVVDEDEPLAVAPVELGAAIKGRAHDELCRLTNRLFPAAPAAPGCVLFTGAESSVGCTWVTVNTARMLSTLQAARACLVCINASQHQLREYFDFSKSPGTDSAFQGLQPRRVAGNLWVLTIRKDDSDVTRGSYSVERVLIELRSSFDHVLLDAPPVTHSSIASSIGPLADGAVLILKASHTRRAVVQLAIERLESAGVRILGTVLNQRDYPIPHSIYKRL